MDVFKLSMANTSVQVRSATIHPSAIVRDLGLPSWQWVVNETSCRQCGCGLLLPPTTTATDMPICRHEVTIRLVLAVVMSRLDYCNSLLAGAPLVTLGPLQHVQSAASRLIFGITPRGQISPSLLQLHWLPVRWCIEYKLCCIMHSVHTRRCPASLKNTVELAAARQSRSDLRSSSTSAYLLPRLKTQVRWACVLTCWSFCMERTAHTHPWRS